MKIINRIINRTLKGKYGKTNNYKLSSLEKVTCLLFPLISIPVAAMHLPTYTAFLITISSLLLWVHLGHSTVMEKHFNLITQDK